MNDTSPDMQKMYRELLMSRSNSERLTMGMEMFAFARSLIVSQLPQDLNDDERNRMIYQRTYGEPAPWPKT